MADFWNDPGNGGDQSVVRHAPDDDSYHVPEGDQLRHMRGSKVGRFAIIPAARGGLGDGRSRGFDANVAGPVHVDPDAPDGGVVFDPNTVRQDELANAVHSARYAHQAYYALGTSAPSLGVGRRRWQGEQPEPRTNSHLPAGGYVAPASTQDGRQVVEPAHQASHHAHEVHPVTPPPPLNSLPPLTQPAPYAPQPQQQPPQQPQYAPQPQQYAPPPPQPQQYAPPQYVNPYAPPPMDPNMQAMMAAMSGMQQQVAALINSQQRGTPPTTGVSPVPMPVGPPPGLATVPREMRKVANRAPDDVEEQARPIRARVTRNADGDIVERRDERPAPRREEPEEPQQRYEQYRKLDEDDHEEGVIVGFESLHIPYVDGPIARKPKRQVIWEIPGAGKHMTRFHDVLVGRNNIVLVYDTRYDLGQQYEPPELDDTPFQIHVVGKDSKNKPKNETYTVSSLGFSFSHGVFDHIVLVRLSDKDQDAGDEE